MNGFSGKTWRAAFTLVELLVVVAIVAALLSLLLPALGGAMQAAVDLKCKSNLRALGTAVRTYAAANRDAFPPLAYWRDRPTRYWWGTNSRPPDFETGFLAPHLGQEAGKEESFFECPAQPWGTYVPQGATPGPTSTYGYNGYYLCPASAPGWAFSIGHRPWQTQSSVREAGKVFMLADTLMAWGGGVVSNNCLLDPPWIWSGSGWEENPFTTVCFRHRGRANVCFVDGHVDSVEPTRIHDREAMTGYVGESNAPHYVPDWEKWVKK